VSQALHLGGVAVGIFLASGVRQLEIWVVPREAHELEAFEIDRPLDRNGFTVNVSDTGGKGGQVPFKSELCMQCIGVLIATIASGSRQAEGEGQGDACSSHFQPKFGLFANPKSRPDFNGSSHL